MKHIVLFILTFAVYSNIYSQDENNIQLKSEIDSLSYSIGYSIGQNIMAQGLEINRDTFAKAVLNALNKTAPVLSDDQMTQIIVSFQQKKMKERDNNLKTVGTKNKKEGEAFLEKNKKMPGVVTTASGLQYKVIEYGKGDSPKLEDKVKVHYQGTLIDGREFDSSYKRGEPIEFGLQGVIPGWTEALQLMHVGDKWELYIPSNLAYGEMQRSELIGPNTTLIFTVELLEIIKAN
ncbi:MAG: FKBP-type peptidyl-prolyl cis-trans isomerase [Bacteroidetes bacterium]|nr:FKBP-type peptidyl-prolyl cis-trans isomerase [Bacteroidota bacterium]